MNETYCHDGFDTKEEAEQAMEENRVCMVCGGNINVPLE